MGWQSLITTVKGGASYPWLGGVFARPRVRSGHPPHATCDASSSVKGGRGAEYPRVKGKLFLYGYFVNSINECTGDSLSLGSHRVSELLSTVENDVVSPQGFYS